LEAGHFSQVIYLVSAPNTSVRPPPFRAGTAMKALIRFPFDRPTRWPWATVLRRNKARAGYITKEFTGELFING
jgi:hypothetical protein